MPGRLRAVLHAARTLLGYGRHLVQTAKQRATTPAFASIAVCFGTANLSTILAHLNRGILRAMALERVLLARTAAGREIVPPSRRCRTQPPAPPSPDPAAPPNATEPSAEPSAEPSPGPSNAPAPRPPRKRASRPACADDPEMFMPTLEELEAEIRRRPLGRTLVAICMDLAVVPAFCTGPFWNELLEIIHNLNGCLLTLMRERVRREKAFAQEQDRRGPNDWHWWDLSRETIRDALGFLIGETRAEPFLPTVSAGTRAAAAIGPP